METWIWIVIGAGAAVIVMLALVVFWVRRRLDRRRLRAREERRAWFDLHELDPDLQDTFLAEWRATQESFVDDPEGAVLDADRLVRAVMRERGYPADDFEQRATDLSIDYPALSSMYRDAHALALSRGHSTEDLRRAIRQYRLLFTELAGVQSDANRVAASDANRVASRPDRATLALS